MSPNERFSREGADVVSGGQRLRAGKQQSHRRIAQDGVGEFVDGILADSTTEWFKTPMSTHDKSKEKRVATLSLDENGTLEGDVTIEYTGHLAVEHKLNNDDDSPVQREENLKEAVELYLENAKLLGMLKELQEALTTPGKFTTSFEAAVR